jgi:hypothetical protein
MKNQVPATPSLTTTRRYQVNPEVGIIQSVLEVVKDAVERHEDVIDHVFVNDKYMDAPETFGSGEMWVFPIKEVPVHQVWIHVPIEKFPIYTG